MGIRCLFRIGDCALQQHSVQQHSVQQLCILAVWQDKHYKRTSSCLHASSENNTRYCISFFSEKGPVTTG